MHGSIQHQVTHLYHASGIKQIGNSKHAAKARARAAGAKTWHELGKHLGIYSYRTADAYRDVWRGVGQFAKETFGLKNMERLAGYHVGAYLQLKIEMGVARATFFQYASACEKLELALNQYAKLRGTGREYDFAAEIQEARAEGQFLARFEGTRAHEHPDRIVRKMQGRYQLIATCQIEGGARLDEVRFKEENLKKLHPDPITGEEKGWLAVDGKGGKKRDIMVSPAAYQAIAEQVLQLAPGPHWGIAGQADRDAYRSEIKKACVQTREDYTGSHGFRWDFAQKRFREVQRAGLSYNEALWQVSHEMGHERADITLHYLK
ncbi:MAG: hypothetical protein JRI66_10975 [Deltaproteobacteria bacterium]|nr:hypothetical protein [Deltaproteobacteria bacterium]